MAVTKHLFSWTESASYAVDANVAGDVIAKLQAEVGEEHLPHRLVTEASKETHPLHGMFQWDDDRAAHAYRVQQARRVISSLRIVVQPGKPAAPAFFSVRVEQAGYETDRHMHITVKTAMASASSRDAVIRAELSRLMAMLSRTALFEEFGPIRLAAKEVEASMARASQAAD